MDSLSIAHLEELLRIQAQQLTALLTLTGQQAETIESLRGEIAELKRRLSQNSGNSSLPPSSDRFNAVSTGGKVKGKGGLKRKSGGQPGHKGHNLAFIPADAVTAVERHFPGGCSACGAAFGPDMRASAHVGEVRQVHDLPPIKLEITAHEQMVVACGCGHVQKGAFPIEVSPGVGYGVRIRALSTLLYTRHAVAGKRICELLEDLCGVRISEGTVLGSVRRSAAALQPHIGQIVAALQQAPVWHLDETKADPWWIHVVSTPAVTLLQAHESRGKVAHEALEARIGAFYQAYRGYMVHDSLALYQMYEQARHSLCGAHLLRELNGLIEQGSKWGQKMHDWFMALYRQCDYAEATVPQDPALGQGGIWQRLRKEYFAILNKADKEEPAATKGAKGRPAASKGRNLLIRLREYAAAVFAFALHPEVPFTNNQAERDLRAVKLKTKVAGCFRNPAFAQHWAVIQSCISTARKQGINPYDMIQAALRAQHITLC